MPLRYVLNRKPADFDYPFPYRFYPEDLFALEIYEMNRAIFEVQDWCIEQFTDDKNRWEVQGGRFNFRDELDATAFRIRWC